MIFHRFTRRALRPALRFCRGFGWWCVVLILLVTSACSRSQHRSGNPAANTAGAAENRADSQTSTANAASGQHLGTVHVIGTGRRFVLIETPSYQPISVLTDGQALVCRTAGAATSTLRVSHERRPPFLVADVASGEPHVGDEVFIDTVPGHSVIPTTASSPLLTPPAEASSVAPTPDFRANPGLPPAH